MTDNKTRLRQLNARLGMPKVIVTRGQDSKAKQTREVHLQNTRYENRIMKLEAELKSIRRWAESNADRYDAVGYAKKAAVFKQLVARIKEALKK